MIPIPQVSVEVCADVEDRMILKVQSKPLCSRTKCTWEAKDFKRHISVLNDVQHKPQTSYFKDRSQDCLHSFKIMCKSDCEWMNDGSIDSFNESKFKSSHDGWGLKPIISANKANNRIKVQKKQSFRNERFRDFFKFYWKNYVNIQHTL